MGTIFVWMIFFLYVAIFVLTPIFLIVAKGVQGLKIYAINFGGFILEIILFFVIIKMFESSSRYGMFEGLEKAMSMVVVHIIHLIVLFIYSFVVILRPAKKLPPPLPSMRNPSGERTDTFVKGESPF